MKKVFITVISSMLLLACQSGSKSDLTNGIRPPAVPLVTVDPYFSIWSCVDEATADVTRHFSDIEAPLISAVRVDGKTYRILGQPVPELETLMPTIKIEDWTARYVMDREPSGDWTSPDYDDSRWEEGPGAFGSRDGGPKVRTRWAGPDRDIWVRRVLDLDEDYSGKDVVVEYSHDDVFELYVNGVEVANTGNTWKNDIREALPEEARAQLKPGKVVLAAHCHNTVGGAYVDFGLFEKKGEAFGEAAVQTSLNVLPMRTIYTFECGGVEVKLTSTAPMFMDDLDLMNRPVNYLSWDIRSTDGQEHDAQLYFSTDAAIALSSNELCHRYTAGSSADVDFVYAGTVDQDCLRTGSERCGWGYYYLAVPKGKGKLGIVDSRAAQALFQESGALAEGPAQAVCSYLGDGYMGMAYVHDFGKVGAGTKSDMVMLAYDERYSLQYFDEDIKPYWARDDRSDIQKELSAAAREFPKLSARCAAFDARLMKDATRVGGVKYAELLALTYRQAIAAHNLGQASDGDLLWFSKENFSGGFINTVDVTYPSAPMFLYYNPELCKGLMNGIFRYSESGRWDKPFAAHDLGHYPCANGQHYGGDMPVEECGNMLVLCAALAKVEGNADYSLKHWNTLGVWADYLVENGLDPVNQLCTDDFAGHFAHNANLSIKAIEGIASYAMLADMLGHKDISAKYRKSAEEMAAAWERMAFSGDHYKLTFDKPESWSQKYNLVWDRVLGLNVFDPEIASTEISYYLTRQNCYGLPLDSRRTYTKTDWIMWTATMAPDTDTFGKFIAPVWDYYNETTDRVPCSDFVYTDSKRMAGFRARSVVGGFWMKLLDEKLNR